MCSSFESSFEIPFALFCLCGSECGQVEAPAQPAQPEPVAEEVPGPDFTGEAPEEGRLLGMRPHES